MRRQTQSTLRTKHITLWLTQANWPAAEGLLMVDWTDHLQQTENMVCAICSASNLHCGQKPRINSNEKINSIMHVTKLCFTVRKLKKNWLSHVTEEYFPNPQMACYYVLSCSFKMGMVVINHLHWSFQKKKKKSVSHTICDRNTQRS